MSKFKVGDYVMVTNIKMHSPNEQMCDVVNEPLLIESLSPQIVGMNNALASHPSFYGAYGKDGKDNFKHESNCWSYDTDYLELASFVKSPLWKKMNG